MRRMKINKLRLTASANELRGFGGGAEAAAAVIVVMVAGGEEEKQKKKLYVRCEYTGNP